MKKILLILLFCPALLAGQDLNKRFQIDASYGLLSSAQLGSMTEDVLVELFTLGDAVNKTNYRFLGPAFLSARYYITTWLALGLTYGIDISKADFEEDDEKIGEYVYGSNVTAFEVRFRYLNKEDIQLYSGISSGFRFGSKKNIPMAYNMENVLVRQWTPHINVFGLSFGRNIRAFFELGFGYKGILDAGISYQF